MDHLQKDTQTETGESNLLPSRFDARLNKDLFPICHLLIELGDSQMRYIVVDESEHEVLAWGEMENSFSSADWINNLSFVDEESSLKNFAQVSLVYSKAKELILPESLFAQQQLDSYFELNFETAPSATSFQKPFESELVVAFEIHQAYDSRASQLFNRYRWLGQSAAFIEQAVKLSRFNKGQRVILHLHENSFHLLIATEGKLLFGNRFEVENNNDILYFTLSTIKEYSLSPSDLSFVCSGTMSNNFLSFAQDYLPGLTTEESLNVKFSSATDLSQSYRFRSLIKTYLCA